MEGGTAHGYEYDHVDQLVCLGVPPVPVYKGSKGGAAGQEEGAPGGVLLPPGVRFPPFLVGIGFGRGKEEREKEGGAPPSPSPIRTRGGGACGPALATSPLLRKGPLRPINLPGGSGNLPVLR